MFYQANFLSNYGNKQAYEWATVKDFAAKDQFQSLLRMSGGIFPLNRDYHLHLITYFEALAYWERAADSS